MIALELVAGGLIVLALGAELAARERCVDCGTRVAPGWWPVPPNRQRCSDCEKTRREASE